MTRPLVSIVMSTYNRADLLARSLICYAKMRFPLDRVEIIVVDDDSHDATAQLCIDADPALDITYIRLRKPVGLWRDCPPMLNLGMRAARGELIICTHPEVMVGRETLTAMCDLATARNYVSAKPYYLSQIDQEQIDSVPWYEEGPLAVCKIPTFYDENKRKSDNPDYTPWSIETIPVWRSFVFSGHRRELWKRLGGLPQTEKWGTVDVLWSQRRRILGIEDVSPQGAQALCVHQHHNAPRVPEGWQKEIATIPMEREKLLWPHVDFL